MTVSLDDRIYTAGLFDGEGCVGLYRDKRRGPKTHASTVVISLVYEPTISWLQRTWGGGVYIDRSRKTHVRIAHCWSLRSRVTITAFLESVRPWLREKAAQADVMLAAMHGGDIVSAAQELKRLKTIEFLPKVTDGVGHEHDASPIFRSMSETMSVAA